MPRILQVQHPLIPLAEAQKHEHGDSHAFHTQCAPADVERGGGEGGEGGGT